MANSTKILKNLKKSVGGREERNRAAANQARQEIEGIYGIEKKNLDRRLTGKKKRLRDAFRAKRSLRQSAIRSLWSIGRSKKYFLRWVLKWLKVRNSRRIGIL